MFKFKKSHISVVKSGYRPLNGELAVEAVDKKLSHPVLMIAIIMGMFHIIRIDLRLV